ncbi:CbiX/SirB N-terminal domain-containing protein [bacterium SCSIO 12741]|nr:CbiX/SirB N-terminal domain-containing protein [bacterium SCSIO 12741]
MISNLTNGSSFLGAISCGGNSTPQEEATTDKKVGVLLVNHGSVSEKWRNMLLDVEAEVKDKILADKKISEVKTAFMEYTEPSIATRLKEFDAENYDEVILVPIFLTVSSHYSHDIPVIAGLSADPKIKEQLGKEKIEVYRAKAKVTITPPLDYSTLLKKNVERRVKALSQNAGNEGVLLVAYGDAQYNQQWEEMVDDIGQYLKVKTGHESIAYSWCGHLVRYSTEPTKKGISNLFELEDKVIVIPILVANDPYFQNDIIQKAVDESENSGNVLYTQDAILPDANLNQWVIDITQKTLQQL